MWLSFEVVQSQVDLRQHANMHIMGRASFDGKDSNLPHPLIGGAEISKPIEVKGNEAAKGDVNHKATSNNVVPNTGGMVGGNIDVSDETEE